ncbi:MAG: hypothetical protein QN178_08785 [Armatimonadota bacterium]|nr:hypothetical protein [Armatimonadota bacterium]
MPRAYGAGAGAVLVILGLGITLAPGAAMRIGLPPADPLGAVYVITGTGLILARLTRTGERFAIQAAGIAFTLIALLGLTSAGAIFNTVAVTPVSNAFHLIVGILGQYAGFGGGASGHS